jgi:hypothetical protein
MLLKRLFYGLKVTLYVVKQSNHGMTMLKLFALPKVVLIPSEILHFD